MIRSTYGLPTIDDDAVAWLEATLDAEDRRSRRMWRHAVLGADAATIMSQRPNQKTVTLYMPMTEFALLRAAARARGEVPATGARRHLTASGYLRSATATALVADGVPPEALPWMGKFGLWTPSP
jgi:hypothetical protein